MMSGNFSPETLDDRIEQIILYVQCQDYAAARDAEHELYSDFIRFVSYKPLLPTHVLKQLAQAVYSTKKIVFPR